MLTETHTAERGHPFYPPPAQRAAIPPLYGTEHIPTAAKIVHLHYFVRDCHWWITELDPHTGLAFGYACLHDDATCAEWGYVDLAELEALHPPGHIQTDAHGRPARILPPVHRRTRPALDTTPSRRPRAPRLARHRITPLGQARPPR